MYFIHHWQSPQAILLLIPIFIMWECCIAQKFWRAFRANEVYQRFSKGPELKSLRSFLAQYLLLNFVALVLFSCVTIFMHTNSPLGDVLLLSLLGYGMLQGIYHYTSHKIRKQELIPLQTDANLKAQKTHHLAFIPQIRHYMVTSCLVFLTLAIMGPEGPEKSIKVQRQPFQIAMLIDLSQSMNARDVAPTRLQAAIDELMTLTRINPHDEYGIIYFTDEAFIQTPPAVDPPSIRAFLKPVTTDFMPTHGTNFSAALMTARQLLLDTATLKAQANKTRRILLVSDGEDHSEQLDRTLKLLQADGIRVDVIGLGTELGGEVYTANDKPLIYQGEHVVSRYDGSTLKRIATETGGLYTEYSMPESAAYDLARHWDTIRVDLAPVGLVTTHSNTQYYVFFFIPVIIMAVGATFMPIFSTITVKRQKRRQRLAREANASAKK